MSRVSKRARAATPAFCAFSVARRTRLGSMSTPRPFAPRCAAPMTMRPSPEPRSIRKSSLPTSAMRSMRSTISRGVTTKGTVPSSQAQAWANAAGAAQARSKERRILKKVKSRLAPR